VGATRRARAAARAARRVALLAGVAALACGDEGGGGSDGSETGADATGGESPARWSELAVGLEGGALLSAASVGDALILVGGNLSEKPGELPGGPGLLVRYERGALCREDDVSETVLWWIDSPSPDEWYAVGERGAIVHERAGARADESVPTDAALFGVQVQGEQVFAVGGDVWGTREGEIWRRDAAGDWAPFAAGLEGVVFKVWGEWFVGDGVAWARDGDALIPRHPPGGAKLLTVHGNAAGDVWAVGGSASPTLLRWRGDAWEELEVDPACASSGLNGVWVADDGVVTIAGFRGGLGRYDADGWACPEGQVTIEDLHVARGHDGRVFAAGGDLFSPGNNHGAILHYGPAIEAVAPEDVGPCP
ncbi:MAG: hypothetical protein KC468_37585, partial [Myxococcales bacterium]|nr:hypothetical protein [Myxococcales bacterium]